MPASQEVTTTTEMQAGLATHAKLEAQVSVLVEVAVETPEDVWALKLLNTIQGIHQLLSEGMTRELYIFGELEVLDAHDRMKRKQYDQPQYISLSSGKL